MFEILETIYGIVVKKMCRSVKFRDLLPGASRPWTPAFGGARRWIPFGPLDICYFMDLLFFYLRLPRAENNRIAAPVENLTGSIPIGLGAWLGGPSLDPF